MKNKLEEMWMKLIFIEEEDEGIELGSDSTKVAKEVSRKCVVIK